ncbi:beta strand repeat-containing protein [Flagellimonas sp.]|uniref:beta strand repeat-containing protein n=1 Tax=Flagellimonas sp. TaxID=2058762 RepID=UPI003B4FFA37
MDDAGTDDQTAAEVTYDNTTSGLTATDTQAAIDEVAAGSTDDQNIESLGVDVGTNILTVGIENGTSQTVDLSHLDDAGTDDQTASEVNITDAGGNFTATEVEGALAELAAGSTDDQNIESLGVDVGTNILTVGIENGTSQTVDLSHLDDAGTDDQTASEVNITDAGGNFTATEVEGALAELAAGSTDDQNIESLGVDLGTNILTVGIENGTSQTVDLSHLDDAGTDDQTASEVNITDSGGNFTATEVEGALAELAAGSTDDQNIESLGVDLGTNILTVGIENGTSQTVDLSHLDDAGTDDQTAAEVTYDNTTSGLTATDTQAAIDEVAAGSTDDQNIESLGVDLGTNILTVGIENGTSQTVDLSHLDDAGTDDQNIESLGIDVGTNILTVGIENGTSQTVDLSHLDDAGTDDQTASEVNITDAGGNFTATEVEGALAELAAQTDDDVSVTNTVAGNRIATISEPGIVSVDINETVTSLTQNTTTGVISYTDEDGGAAETANVVSTDANNELTVGADGGASFEMTDIDVDGDGAAETTVDEAMADIAKITATAGRIFYPPSIAVDASTTGIKNIDLYQEYLDQFGTPTAGSSGAPVAIPTYARTDLYYYVTYADPTVFETDSGDPNFMTIDANGNLTIEVENLPTDYNSLINVVFVVK